ncbi:hypothetical protein [Novosphingobium sp. YAF33]|uniref:hypothetical protein n=1 Tax=Novosphingobium sp. YAF33 TaxID=3233082 RepID=UPI003F98D931
MRQTVIDGQTETQSRPDEPPPFAKDREFSGRIYTVVLITLVLAAFAIRVCSGMTRVILHDEFYHYFAGLSFGQSGTFAIGNGEYVRAAPYTALTALSMLAFGDGLLALRLPAILSGTLLVAAVALWLQRSSRFAALAAATLLAFDYFGIQLSGFARFYTLHGLMVWLGAVGTYTLVTKKHSPARAAMLVMAVVSAFALALELQILTLICIAALAAWAVLDRLLFVGKPIRIDNRKMAALLAVLLAILVAALALSPLPKLLVSLYARFWNAAPWSRQSQFNYLYYVQFMRSYGLLAYLFPLGLICAWFFDKRKALFLSVLFVVPLLIASVAPQKAERYVFSAFPFFLALWALAAGWVFDIVRQQASRRDWPAWRAPLLTAILALAVLGSAYNFRSNPGRIATFVRSGDIVSPEKMKRSRNFDWGPWLPALRGAVSGYDKIVGVDDMRTLYFLGRLDLMLNRTIQWDLSHEEFARDTRTGVLMISEPNSIELYIRCTRSGVIIVPEGRWRDYSVISSTADAIEKVATRSRLPADMPFRIYTWKATTMTRSAECKKAPFRQ